MTNRTEKRFSSLALPQGFRFGFYPSLSVMQEELGDNAEAKILEIVERQLSAHSTATWARDQFTTDIERVTGFAFLTEEKQSKKDSTKTIKVNAESEADYVDRFRAAALEGFTFSPAKDLGMKVDSGKDGVLENDDETSIVNELKGLAQGVGQTVEKINSWLQDLADLRVYPLDARVIKRVGKEKGLPKYATEAANGILTAVKDGVDISQKLWDKWTKTFHGKDIALPSRSGDITIDAKVLAQCIVANEAYDAAKKYAV